MNRLLSISLCGAIALTASPALAAGTCEPQFVDAAQTVTLDDIVVASGGSSTQNFQLRVGNSGDAGGICSAALRIARLSTSPSQGEIVYSLRSLGQTLQILRNETTPGSAASDLSIPNLPSGPNGRAVTFQLTVPSGWGISSGAQADDLIAMLVDDTGKVVDTMLLHIVLSVAPSVEVRIVGATGNDAIASVDMGILDPRQTNLSDPFGVRVWSTSPYTLSFVSQHTGALVHSGLGNRIPYRLFMDGAQITPNGSVAAYVARKTDALGDYHPLSIRIEPFEARAGSYSDKIEVTVSAS